MILLIWFSSKVRKCLRSTASPLCSTVMINLDLAKMKELGNFYTWFLTPRYQKDANFAFAPACKFTNTTCIELKTCNMKQLKGSSKKALTGIIISAIAGILLKSEDVYFFFSKILSRYWIIQIFCSAVTVSLRINFLSCRRQFNSRAMERASGNCAFVRWCHWDEASEC